MEELSPKYFGGAEKRSLLIVTVSDIVDTVIDNIKNKNYGDYFVTGVCILDKKAKGRVIDGVTVVADEDDLVEYVCREWVDELFITIPESGFWHGFFNVFSSTHPVYIILYFLLIIGFAFFYVAIQYNPVEMANNLRQNNGTIPGIRPGKPTSDFIAKILSKLTLIGAIFLGVIALLPIIFSNLSGMHGLSIGGTSILILVGVALETVKQMESQMMMRHYKGFLD